MTGIASIMISVLDAWMCMELVKAEAMMGDE